MTERTTEELLEQAELYVSQAVGSQYWSLSLHHTTLLAELAAKLRNTTKQEEALEEALTEILKGEGAYSKDQHTFAVNVIENTQKIAKQALQQTEEQRR